MRFGDRNNLLVRALGLALDAYPSGMTVLGLLQGLLDRSNFGGDMLARKVPTYFGMLVALFRSNEKGYRIIGRNIKP